MVLTRTTNLPRTLPKDRVPSLYLSAVRYLEEVKQQARVVAATTTHEKPEALKDLKQTRDTFAVFATTIKHSHTIDCFKRMDQWADLLIMGDGKLARIIDDAGRKVARAFTAAVYISERSVPAAYSNNSFDRIRIDINGPGEASPNWTFYAADIAAASIVVQTCLAFVNKPRDWHKTHNFAWCTKSLIRQRRKRAWDCIENSLAYFGIIEPPSPQTEPKNSKKRSVL
jgi:hypothetical protein